MSLLCTVRDLCRAIGEFEKEFSNRHNIPLNAGMILCTLKERRLSSGEIAKEINLTCSNTSKLIRSLEDKGYVSRIMGERDRRQMYFSLTEDGKEVSKNIEEGSLSLSGPLKEILQNI